MKKIILSLIIFTAALFATIKIVNVKAEVTAPVLTKGAQIRTDNYAGLKFVATTTPVDGATYGFVLAKGEVANLTVETVGSIKGETTSLNDNNQFYVTMTGFPETAYVQDFTVRAYVLVNGVYTYSEDTVTRNASEVAIGAKGKGSTGDFIDTVTSYTTSNYMKVYTDAYGRTLNKTRYFRSFQ